jgi:hypothetical protein
MAPSTLHAPLSSRLARAPGTNGLNGHTADAALAGRASLPNPLEHPICLEEPERLTPYSNWTEHIPFAMFLVDLLRPDLLVELGSYYGASYCAFCQAMKALHPTGRCYAVDTWQGDPHGGFYGPEALADLRAHHDPLYGSFSHLLQGTFDEALPAFRDGSIDLLHIDGYHTYEAVSHDFAAWRPKLSDRGVVLLHDISVDAFGIQAFWHEATARYPHFAFWHGYGLGLLLVGRSAPPALQAICQTDEAEAAALRELFYHLGHRLTLKLQMAALEQRLAFVHRRHATEAADLHKQLAAWKKHWSDLERGFAWRALERLRRWRRRIAPPGTRRARWLRRLGLSVSA